MPKAQSGNGTNGNGHGDVKNGGMFRALGSVILERYKWARSMGMTFGGARDVWGKLGYPETLTVSQYMERYERGGIAARIIDTLPKATWRGDMWLEEDENPNRVTPFEKAWDDLNNQLKITAALERVDKLSRLSNYAVLLIGAEGALDTELPKGKPGKLLYLQAYLGAGGPTGTGNSVRVVGDEADATITDLELDTQNERFGLPRMYQLKRMDVSSAAFQKPVHWTRVIHIAEGCLRDDVYGQPALARVWNYLEDLDKVVGGGSESFWLRANQGLHLDIDKDMALDDVQSTIENLKQQSEEYKHQLTRWLRTRGVDAKVLGSDVANFSNPMDAIVTLIAGATGIPKRILVGSEMGELASSQDRENFKDLVNGRQSGYAGPYIVRPLVDRLIKYGYLPTPKQYDVKWPHVEVLTETEKWEGAKAWATVNQTQGTPVFKSAEIRDKFYGLQPLTPEELQEENDAKQAAAPKQEPPAEVPPKDEPVDDEQLVAAQDAELLRVLQAAIETGADDVVHEILGMRTLGDRPGHPFRGNQWGDARNFIQLRLNFPGDAPRVTTKEFASALNELGYRTLDDPSKIPEGSIMGLKVTGDLPQSAVDGVIDGLKDIEAQAPGLHEMVKQNVMFASLELEMPLPDEDGHFSGETFRPMAGTLTTNNKQVVVMNGVGEVGWSRIHAEVNPEDFGNVGLKMARASGLTGDALARQVYKTTVVHEIGHVADMARGGGYSEMLALEVAARFNGDSENIMKYISKKLSPYAASSPQEAAAELFAAVIYKQPIPAGMVRTAQAIRQSLKQPYAGN